MPLTIRRCINSVCWCALIVLSCNFAAADTAELIARVEATPLPPGYKTIVPRVTRNAAGEITRLNLDHFTLKPGDMEEIAKCTTLERLWLPYTNVTDDQLKLLAGSKRLTGLILNHTSIGDAGLKHLARIKSLKSLCLGGVDASSEAVKQLRKDLPDMQVGYVRNKRP